MHGAKIKYEIDISYARIQITHVKVAPARHAAVRLHRAAANQVAGVLLGAAVHGLVGNWA